MGIIQSKGGCTPSVFEEEQFTSIGVACKILPLLNIYLQGEQEPLD